MTEKYNVGPVETYKPSKEYITQMKEAYEKMGYKGVPSLTEMQIMANDGSAPACGPPKDEVVKSVPEGPDFKPGRYFTDAKGDRYSYTNPDGDSYLSSKEVKQGKKLPIVDDVRNAIGDKIHSARIYGDGIVGSVREFFNKPIEGSADRVCQKKLYDHGTVAKDGKTVECTADIPEK
jgi:hypothetical protein